MFYNFSANGRRCPQAYFLALSFIGAETCNVITF